jgi:hypothetical protein
MATFSVWIGSFFADFCQFTVSGRGKLRLREQAMETIVGTGKYRYRVHEDWAHVPVGVDMKPAAVTVDPLDRVYCFNRSPEHPVVVFDRSGEFLFSWGAGLFRFPHAIRFDAGGFAWLTDEHHMQFMKFTPDGELLQTIGRRGHRSLSPFSPAPGRRWPRFRAHNRWKARGGHDQRGLSGRCQRRQNRRCGDAAGIRLQDFGGPGAYPNHRFDVHELEIGQRQVG